MWATFAIEADVLPHVTVTKPGRAKLRHTFEVSPVVHYDRVVLSNTSQRRGATSSRCSPSLETVPPLCLLVPSEGNLV